MRFSIYSEMQHWPGKSVERCTRSSPNFADLVMPHFKAAPAAAQAAGAAPVS